jgi:hypothetical protein
VVTDDEPDEPEPDEPVEVIEEPRFVAPAGGWSQETSAPAVTVASVAASEPPSPLTAFSAWASGQDMALVKATAKRLFPDVTRFGDLSVDQLDLIVSEVEQVTGADVDEEDEEELLEEVVTVAPDAEESSPSEETPAEVAVGEVTEQTAPAPSTKPALCGAKSPISGSTCTMDAGHKGVHRAGLREAW